MADESLDPFRGFSEIHWADLPGEVRARKGSDRIQMACVPCLLQDLDTSVRILLDEAAMKIPHAQLELCRALVSFGGSVEPL